MSAFDGSDPRARMCGLVGDAVASQFAWLDSGSAGRSLVGVVVDREVVGNDWRLLDEVEQAWRADPSRRWIGWITYDIGARRLVEAAPASQRLPSICLRRYAAVAQVDEASVAYHGDPAAERDLAQALARSCIPEAVKRWPLSSLQPQWSPAQYRQRVNRAREHIVAGNTYQVNLSQEFRATWHDQPASLAESVRGLYWRLHSTTPAPMGALIGAGDTWIVSNSPETLLRIEISADDRAVARTWPIKGTRPRGTSQTEDDQAIAALRSSAKDRAEHTMIVDLSRNDLGRVARPGTVSVRQALELMTLPTVHHLVSEVRCELQPDWTLASVLASLFPGGSVTGAPKRRTMEIIAELEGRPREIYCGGIVLLEPTGVSISIPIRTGLVDADGLWLRSGGGIVFDSDPEQERLETWAKAAAFGRGRAECS